MTEIFYKNYRKIYRNYLSLKYFPATLIAKLGKIINTQVNNNFNKVAFGSTLSGLFGPKFPDNIIIKPTKPKQIEEIIKTLVAILCIFIIQLYSKIGCNITAVFT